MSKISRRELMAMGAALGLGAVASATPVSRVLPKKPSKEKLVDLYRRANEDAAWTQRYNNLVQTLIEKHGHELSPTEKAAVKSGNCFQVCEIIRKEVRK